MPENDTKIFDPRDPASPSHGDELLDATIAKGGDQWFMYLAGQPRGYGATDVFSAFLAPSAPLSATGWRVNRAETGKLVPLAQRTLSAAWDERGGRHCPSYVRGWDPTQGQWVERIYYAGAAENLWGPYKIGFLEWDGLRWRDQREPAFVANEEWERGSVYEPNLIYHDGKWKLWYVAGSNFQGYLVHGYAESEDGRSGWSKHVTFAPPEMKMFDFCVLQRGNAFDAIFARVALGEGTESSDTGLWWTRATHPSGVLSDWSKPLRIMGAEDRGWHSGPWKPSFHVESGNRAFVFFDGSYRTSDPGPFPFAFTLGCFAINLPE